MLRLLFLIKIPRPNGRNEQQLIKIGELPKTVPVLPRGRIGRTIARQVRVETIKVRSTNESLVILDAVDQTKEEQNTII
jgi:hypothetical protein